MNSSSFYNGTMNTMNFSLDYNDSYIYESEDIDSEKSEIFFEFITHGILITVVGILGIMGNIISMIILTRPQMRSSINYLLTGLARSDTALIVTSILLFGLPAIYKYTKTVFLFGYYTQVYPFLSTVVFPLALISQTVSVYLTLTVTLERFVAVCHPLQARSLCTYGRARFYVVIIIFFSIVYNLPRFWEIKLEEETAFVQGSNLTYRYLAPRATALRNDPVYISVYVNWCYLIFVYFLPFSCLAFLNTAIYRQVRKANKERQRLSRHQKKEIGLATMLLIVVTVFFLCNILALVNNVLEAVYDFLLDRMVKTSNLLVTINSSVNFIIYVIFGEKFKRMFLKLFCSHSPIVCGSSGRESPDGGTVHEESVMISNGDPLRQSVRAGARTTNGSVSRKSVRALPVVYYPARTAKPNNWTTEETTVSTHLSQL